MTALTNMVTSITTLTPLKGKANPRSIPNTNNSKTAIVIPVMHRALGIEQFPAAAVTSGT
jgi:hypothetical protein